MLTCALPDQEWVEALEAADAVPDGVRLVVWPAGPDDDLPLDAQVVVPPYMRAAPGLDRLGELPHLRVVQTLTAGYDDIAPRVPRGVLLCNAAGVHDASTAELAVGLALASLRGLGEAVRDAGSRRWAPVVRRSLADRRVLLVGFGGVGQAVAARLAAFEVEVTPVATTARTIAGRQVRAVTDLPGLLPHHDVVVLTVPLSDSTRGLVDRDFLAAMPDGSLLVNVARGPVVDTTALLAELRAGRLLAALDVVDPEPLPEDHELWEAPGLLLTPHVGGATTAFRPRAVTLLGRQLTRLAHRQDPANIVG